MKVEFGIMQGRLTPQYEGRYQSHPRGHWQGEFFIAKTLGLDLIEFIVDSWYLNDNPLLTASGLAEVKAICQDSGVNIKSVCADVFMDITFFGDSAAQACELLQKLIKVSVELNIRDIVIPCVDRSSLNNLPQQTAQFVQQLKPLCRYASSQGVRLNFETDLAPAAFDALLNALGREYAWVNYDIGNSASLGFCANQEFDAYSDRISNVHIKDRVLHGASITLGAGNADFASVIARLKTMNYSGPLIFQASRASNFVDDLSGVAKQITWFKKLWQ
ncbi:MAG: sugar phosphate isomerase/epimerase [Paraglaciecola sp.]|nr:sugar phosphate isomerase/epimerase [Paraglaciecola sp.]